MFVIVRPNSNVGKIVSQLCNMQWNSVQNSSFVKYQMPSTVHVKNVCLINSSFL